MYCIVTSYWGDSSAERIPHRKQFTLDQVCQVCSFLFRTSECTFRQCRHIMMSVDQHTTKRKSTGKNHDNPEESCKKRKIRTAVDPTTCHAKSGKAAVETRPDLTWKKLSSDGLDLDYCAFLTKSEGDILFEQCEKELQYNKGHLARIRIFGKWVDIPRKQVLLITINYIVYHSLHTEDILLIGRIRTSPYKWIHLYIYIKIYINYISKNVLFYRTI